MVISERIIARHVTILTYLAIPVIDLGELKKLMAKQQVSSYWDRYPSTPTYGMRGTTVSTEGEYRGLPAN
jgi:hypothetical protein